MLNDSDYLAARQLAAGLSFLGIDTRLYDPRWVQHQTKQGLSPDLRDEAEKLIDARNAARKAKNFAESDRIRDELLAKGIVLKDGPDGTIWEVKR